MQSPEVCNLDFRVGILCTLFTTQTQCTQKLKTKLKRTLKNAFSVTSSLYPVYKFPFKELQSYLTDEDLSLI